MILFSDREEWITEAIKMGHTIAICHCEYRCNRDNLHSCDSIVAKDKDGNLRGVFKTFMKYGYFHDVSH